VVRMRMQMAKLEDMLEQQANINKMDEEHLSKLETALAEVQEKGPVGVEVLKLESALHAEQEAKAEKEAELEGMHTLVAKLEETIDQQSKVAELNKEQQSVIVDLVSSLTEEKKKVEELSKSEETAVAQLQQQLQTLQKQLEAAAERKEPRDEQAHARLEDMEKRLEQMEAEVNEKDEEISKLETTASTLTLARDEYARQVSNMSGVSDSSEVQIAVLNQQLEDVDAKYRSLARDMKHREAHAAGLQAQLACEESKRRAAEQVICAAENEIRHLKDAAKASQREKGSKSKPGSRGSSPGRRTPISTIKQNRDVQEQLKKELAFRKQAQETITAKENEVLEMKQKLIEEEEEHLVVKEQAVKMQEEVTELQRRLSDELSQRQAMQTKLIERERKSIETQKEAGEKTSVKAALSKVLEKDVQICELQQELQDELSKRQMVQSKAMEVEEQLCLAQQQLALELSRRVEAESKAVEKDGQLKTIRTHFAQELLHSMQKSATVVTAQDDIGSFRSEGSDDGGSSLSSSWRGVVGLPWSRATTGPPDTGSSMDDGDHFRPLGASSYDTSEQKPRSSFGFTNPASPQRSPTFPSRQLDEEDQLTKSVGHQLRTALKQRSYPTGAAHAPGQVPATSTVNIYTPCVPGATRSSLPVAPNAAHSFLPMATGHGASVNVQAPQGSVRVAPTQSFGTTASRTANKEVYSYATTSPNLSSVARVIRAASKQ